MRNSLCVFLLIPFFFLNMMTIGAVFASESEWTEKRLGKVIMTADGAARHRRWSVAIKYGELALEGSRALGQEDEVKYIHRLKNINQYYDRAGRLSEIANRVKKAHYLSLNKLDKNHSTATVNRLLYYKSLIFQKKYELAIPLVWISLSTLGGGEENDFRRLHYLKQLYSLYGILGRLEDEEKILIQYLKKTKEIIGKDQEDYIKAQWFLAQNYCRRGLIEKFKEVVQAQKLKYYCK